MATWQGGAMTAAGWYPDPWRQAPLRYWDGLAWTGYLHPGFPGAPPIPASSIPAGGAAINRSPLAWYLAAALVVVVALGSIAVTWLLSR